MGLYRIMCWDVKKAWFPCSDSSLVEKNEMHDWVVSIIKDSATEHLIDKQYVLGLLEAHCAGKGDYSRKIWTVLTFYGMASNLY
ncbi:hypothetical protein GCM10020331_064430 [Ectobacillus funiculus]